MRPPAHLLPSPVPCRRGSLRWPGHERPKLLIAIFELFLEELFVPPELFNLSSEQRDPFIPLIPTVSLLCVKPFPPFWTGLRP